VASTDYNKISRRMRAMKIYTQCVFGIENCVESEDVGEIECATCLVSSDNLVP
jgi:hypothetical protein